MGLPPQEMQAKLVAEREGRDAADAAKMQLQLELSQARMEANEEVATAKQALSAEQLRACKAGEEACRASALADSLQHQLGPHRMSSYISRNTGSECCATKCIRSMVCAGGLQKDVAESQRSKQQLVEELRQERATAARRLADEAQKRGKLQSQCDQYVVRSLIASAGRLAAVFRWRQVSLARIEAWIAWCST